MFNARSFIQSDIAWLGISLLLSISLMLLFFGNAVFTPVLDIHVHDTYFVVSTYQVFLFILLLASFLLFFYRTGRPEYRTARSFRITCVCGSAIVLFIAVLAMPFALKLALGNYTIYPPLSGLAKEDAAPDIGLPFMVVTGLGVLLAATVLAMTVYKAFRWGQFTGSNVQ